jgi:mannose-binding lectin 2
MRMRYWGKSSRHLIDQIRIIHTVCLYLDYGGDAVIDANHCIRLTTEEQSRQGWIWSKLPLPEDAWQVEFEFKVHGKNHIYGDGFAFWATSDRAKDGKLLEPKSGPVFGNQDYFNGLGIFFDTYMNGNNKHYFPYVMAMLGDGRTSYDLEHDGKANDIAGCEASFRNVDRMTRARVTYYKGAQLKLELAVREDNEFHTCFVLNQNITLPPKSYLGFSAHTGELVDNHDIIWVSTTEIPNRPPVIIENERFASQTYQSGSALSFFFKLVLFSVICGVGVVGYRMYQNQGNKRF